MIRVMESDFFNKEEIAKQVGDIYAHETDYWKEGEWVVNKWRYENPTSKTTRGSSLVYVTSSPQYQRGKYEWELGWIYVKLYYVKGHYLYEQEKRAGFSVEDNEVTLRSYLPIYNGSLCRIKKTSLKTPDKKDIFSPAFGDKIANFRFVKDDDGFLVPYFGEVIEPKKRGSEI